MYSSRAAAIGTEARIMKADTLSPGPIYDVCNFSDIDISHSDRKGYSFGIRPNQIAGANYPSPDTYTLPSDFNPKTYSV
jgi:hypothetical protein